MANSSDFSQEFLRITDKLSGVFNMLDKFEKLEEKINEGLTKLLTAIISLVLKLIPNSIQNKYISKKTLISNWKSTKIQNTKTKAKNGFTKLNAKKDAFFNKINEIQKYPIKEKAIEKIKAFKTFILTTPPKQHLINAKNFFNPKIQHITNKIRGINKTTAILSTSLTILLFLGAFSVYTGMYDIVTKEFPSRNIASVQEYDYRPDYQMYEQKTLKVLNVKVPIFVEGIGKIDSITIDFSLRTSTRFAKYYLIEYEYKLKDYFFTTVEPVVSDFPIETEGKEVLKEKIRDEINNFLYENYVEGEVEEVNILYMVGS